jgi:hypothetical protein
MVAFWILVCAFLNCVGWILSACHMLNRTGYAIAFTLGAIAALVWRACAGDRRLFRVPWGKLSRRFRKPFPLAFLILAGLAFLGGALYAPTNYDALAYRVPRMLHWLAAEQWHWTHTAFAAFNTRTCGIEWVSTPLLLFLRTDRLLFLISFASFLLLPGLIFSLFRRVGCGARTAWHWMWLLPTGYCFLLQAGAIANDLFGVVFPLAALDFALRARRSGRLRDAGLSLLAAAMMTSAKATNLPLLLPWLIALAPSWRLFLTRPLVTIGTGLLAAGASFLPTAVLNWHACRDWTGRIVEGTSLGSGPVWVHWLNNGIMLVLENLTPPFFPLASAWNNFTDHIIPERLAVLLQASFEPGAAHWRLGEMQTEEVAGLGFGVTTLLVLSFAVTWCNPRLRAHAPKIFNHDWNLMLVTFTPWVAMAHTMAVLGLSGVSRYTAPYYLLLLMGLMKGLPAAITRHKWWRLWAGGVFALAALILIASQARPLWPSQWVLEGRLRSTIESSSLGRRVITVYGVYRQRANAFAPVRDQLPTDALLVGMMTKDDPETSMWRPFGARRILHVLPRDSAADARRRGLKYVLVKEELLQEPWPAWLERMNARVLKTFDLKLRAGREPSRWYLIELVSTGDKT